MFRVGLIKEQAVRLHRNLATLGTLWHKAKVLRAPILKCYRLLACLIKGLVKLCLSRDSDQASATFSFFIATVHEVHVTVDLVDMRLESLSVPVSHLTVWIL